MKRNSKTYLQQFCTIALFLLSNHLSFAQDDAMDKSANSAMQYTSTPKHMWEFGINGGFNIVTGDVDFAPGFGGGLHIRRAIDNIFSIRLDGQYRQLNGFEKEDSRNPDAKNSPVLGSGPNGLGYGTLVSWFPNYRTTMYSGTIQLVMSLNQFRFLKPNRTMNPYIFGGAGLTSFKVKADALDKNNAIYNFTSSPSKGDLDGTYETELVLTSDDLNKNNLSGIVDVGAGIAFKISKRFNIGIEQKITGIFGRGSDFLDGAFYRSDVDQTNNRDLISSTYIRLNFNIGNKEKRSEPLWWINPLDFVLNDIAELKARPKLDLTDTDGDGIIDMLDQEKESPAGAAVDTRGVVLDSDTDGVPNYLDKEPYSPPNYKVNADGVADVPKDFMTQGDVNKLIDAKLTDFKLTKNSGAANDMFLPMIHFDLDKYTVKSTEVEKLAQIAAMLQNNPELKIVVSGHTDKLASEEYNQMLSFNRAKASIEYLVNRFGIARERLVLNYGGEESSLINASGNNYINRRAEFRVARPADSEMKKPLGPKAGSGKIEGSRDAGY